MDEWDELHSEDLEENEDNDNIYGEQRPNPQDVTLYVKASQEFVTVHDYVSAVHSWLTRKYDNLLGALACSMMSPVFHCRPESI